MTSKRLSTWLVAALAAASLASACGDDATDDGTGGTGGGTAGEGGGGAGGTGGSGGEGGTGGTGGCADSTACSGETPVCDTTVDGGVCVACTAGEGCAEGSVCDTSVAGGACVTCTETAGCGGDTPICDTTVTGGVCVSCTETAGCEAPDVCDTSVAGGACVACLEDAHCAGGVCDLDTNECVGCLETADCDAGSVCDTDAKSCVTCTSAEGCTDGSVCNTEVEGGVCVECVVDTDCAATDVCVQATNTCALRGSAEIAAVRAATPATGATSPVTGVFVTYARPALGSDPAGFFVQAEQEGPALFVAVDPLAIPPGVAVGDLVSFTVTDSATAAGMVHVTGVANLVVDSSGNDVSGLAQDLTNVDDTVTALDGYEAELISMTGTVGAFRSAGGGHESAEIATAGLATGELPKLRIPQTLRAELDLAEGCELTVVKGAMWRYNAGAQPSAFDAADIDVVSCPAPNVVGAAAASGTSVVVTFDRVLDAGSVLADGTQFTVDNGLDVTGAEVTAANEVTLTTELQTGDTAYTVAVASTVEDIYGAAVALPGTASFTGFMTPATLLITELNANISSGHDLVELYALTGGTVNGFTLTSEDSATISKVLATLPNVWVSAGDFIVIHLVPEANVATETASKTEFANATYTGNYDSAWDVAGGTSGLTYSHRVILVKNAVGGIVDAVPFSHSTTGSPPGYFLTALANLQANGLWFPATCGGVACTYTSTPTATDVGVDLYGTENSATGTSVQRVWSAAGPLDTMQKSDWVTPTANTWGAASAIP